MSRSRNYLFSKHKWFQVEKSQERALRGAIDSADEQSILETSMDELCKSYEGQFKIDVPVLCEEEIVVSSRESPVDISFDFVRGGDGSPRFAPGTLVEVKVPFSGEAEAFNITPTTRSTLTPQGEIANGALVLEFRGIDMDPEKLREAIDKDIKNVKKYLDFLRNDANKFNGRIIRLAKEWIESRRQRLQANRKLVVDLGYPAGK